MQLVDQEFAVFIYNEIYSLYTKNELTTKDRILRYRSLLEDIYKEIVKNDKFVNLVDLNARIIYVSKEYNISKEIINLAYKLKRISTRAAYDQSFRPNQNDEKVCLSVISNIIKHISRIEIPEEISNLINGIDIKIYDEYSTRDIKSEKFDIFGIVQNIDISPMETEKFIILKLYTEEFDLITLRVYKNDDNLIYCDLTEIVYMLNLYDKLFITNAIVVNKELKEFKTDKKSIIVVNPDYLIDVKDIAECRQNSFNNNSNGSIKKWYVDNHYYYFLKRFNVSKKNESMLLGNVINQVLDDIVIKFAENKVYERKEVLESLKTAIQYNAIGFLSIVDDNGEYNNSKVKEIYDSIYEQLDTLSHVINEFKGGSFLIEPTYISNKYGIIGRLDLQIDFEGNRKDIIELKSSKNFPQNGYTLYHNHEAQTYCYHLLLKSAFPNREGENYILYSRANKDQNPLRYLSTADRYVQIQDMMMLRNKIVYNELKISRGDFSIFDEILNNEEINFPVYFKEFFKEFKENLKNLSQLENKYFFEYIRFIYNELKISKIGNNDSFIKNNGFASLWLDSLQDKMNNYNVLTKLQLENINEEFHIKLKLDGNLFDNDANITSFREGDIVLFYPMKDDNTVEPLSQQILKGYVLQISVDYVVISLYNKQVSKEYFTKYKLWCIEKDFRDMSYRQMLQNLYEFIKSPGRVKNLVFGLEKPMFEDNIEMLPNQLDKYQNKNIENALKAKDYYLIQGPPGTGKTSTVLVEIVKNLTFGQKDILILAFTNRAVDEIISKLVANNINCIRIGRGDENYHFENIIKNNKLNELYRIVKSTKVIVSTVQSFLVNLDLVSIKNFGTLIIDEASQILEPQIVGILKYFDKWIFIGDENQLPAVVQQEENDLRCKSKILQGISLNSFGESLFYRLKLNAINKGWSECYGMLQNHYRMHDDIAKFISKKFYGNLLVAATEKQKEAINKEIFIDHKLKCCFENSRIVFIPSIIDKTAKINDNEAYTVVKLIEYIGQCYGEQFVPEETVGVITPFRAQIVNIRNRLSKKYQAITIDTIERYQGSERDIIILSFAVNNISQLKRLQMINDLGVDRKLNVALSRAKKHLIITGVEDVLTKIPIYNDLIEHIKNNKGYIDYFNKLILE
ncbi:MAG TPA: AAA domain-containing protein [Ignavibacteriales bacterium]|nr:AAA domain-containing protein [Ignavibacteriales bacterium]HPD68428.1 AAA domain-containing protein [Ignavibacteriales bacterium]HRR17936.1 AAA domain-containing protein [Ignavibacteriales bacterium]HRT98833.1 AAA domain-containing protein [Ignavibacteriales bacterium]